VEQLDSKWFLLDPEGQPFHLRGLNHYANGLYMPYNLRKRYGSCEAWRMSVRDRHREWGFTYLPPSVGPAVLPPPQSRHIEEGNHEWTAEEFAEMEYPFTAFLEIPRRYMGSGDEYPDVFSSDFRRMVEKRCREFVAPLKDNPYLIGYHFAHNPPWHDKAPGFEQWIKDVVSRSDGRVAWIDLMRRIYGNLDRYRETYGIVLESFEDIHTVRFPLKSYISAVKGNRDRIAFMRRICEEWYKVFTGTIREYDTNHILLGDRNTTHLFPIADYAMYIMERFVDVLSLNVMGPMDIVYEVLEQVTPHWTGPIHLADTGAGICEVTQKQSGFMCKDLDEFERLYRGHLQAALSHPQLIGFGWCGYYEIPGDRSGVVDVRTDKPLEDRLKVMRKWNSWFQREWASSTA
jgi:hypothetical protein